MSGLREAEAALPEGRDTWLGKIRSGSKDISGGQWQRLALARCIFSQAKVQILDEPTAALDPIAERGNHRELIEKKGIYASMFEAQRSWYQS